MKIGIAYDTQEMYDFKSNDLYFDFAEQASIDELKSSLEEMGHKVELVGNAQNILKLIKNNYFDFDLIYNTVEGVGTRNREGLVPAILETHNIPYIGTDAFGLSLTLNKMLTKVLAEKIGVITPKYYYVTTYNSEDDIKENLANLKFPVIIKPNYEGNSSGISVQHNLNEAFKCVTDLMMRYNSPILCEEFISGKEITVPVIGNSESDIKLAVTTVDIQKSDDFWLDINCKSFGDYKNILINSDKINSKISKICKKLFFAIGCKDFSRFDFRIDKENTIYFIEANPLPALFKGGSFDILGQSLGLEYKEMLQFIIDTARKRIGI